LAPVPQLPEASLSRDRHDARAARLVRDAREHADRLAAYE
jgi:hypothetical protein